MIVGRAASDRQRSFPEQPQPAHAPKARKREEHREAFVISKSEASRILDGLCCLLERSDSPDIQALIERFARAFPDLG